MGNHMPSSAKQEIRDKIKRQINRRLRIIIKFRVVKMQKSNEPMRYLSILSGPRKILYMKNLVSVPNPCHASWDKMKPQENGRHCNSCDKIVVDFTSMSDEELRDYFKQHQSQKFCGHFKAEQVKRLKIIVKPKEFKNNGWDIYQISKVAIFLVFFSSLFSCTLKNDDGASPEIVIENASGNEDSIHEHNLSGDVMLGKMESIDQDTSSEAAPKTKREKSISNNTTIEIQGEAELETVTEDYNKEILTGIPRPLDE
jgi:hypothetical protein